MQTHIAFGALVFRVVLADNTAAFSCCVIVVVHTIPSNINRKMSNYSLVWIIPIFTFFQKAQGDGAEEIKLGFGRFGVEFDKEAPCCYD